MTRRPVQYVVDDRYAWLNEPSAPIGETNIGTDGQNLTLVFLSMNRTSLSIRLLKSFVEYVPHFAGKILIVDNGSDAAELAILKKYLQEQCPFNYEVLELDKNYGVSGGRNRGYAAVTTDWIMSLDNDIYLTGNPLPQIKRDLSLLGVHFLSVPLVNPDRETLYSFGANLDPMLVHGSQPFLGLHCLIPPGSDLDQVARFSPNGDGFLCTFLFGGASVFKRSTHDDVGLLDEAMFVGFEDLEFSLRLYQRGYKIGASCVTMFVHEHPPGTLSPDQEYERQRYSRQTLKRSADHFEEKHGIQVWSEGVDQWLRDREQDQGIDSQNDSAGTDAIAAVAKPRIALVVDSPSWAYANIARQIALHLSDRFVIDIISTWDLSEIDRVQSLEAGDVGTQPIDRHEALARILLQSSDYDLVHIFWRAALTIFETTRHSELAAYLKRLDMKPGKYKSRHVRRTRITTSVYDHLFLDGDISHLLSQAMKHHVIGYSVSSERLFKIYENHRNFELPDAVIQDGVDTSLFHPQNLDRFDNADSRELVIGWVGNSNWGADTGQDVKGVHTVLKPALAQLEAEGVPVRADFLDRQIVHMPHDQMADYYARIDVLICASSIEGTPNPVLEAMACGVPVISTDVGIVPEALGPLQSDFILPVRSIDAFKVAIRRLVGNPQLLKSLSDENLERVQNWTWKRQAEKFAAFFKAALEVERMVPAITHGPPIEIKITVTESNNRHSKGSEIWLLDARLGDHHLTLANCVIDGEWHQHEDGILSNQVGASLTWSIPISDDEESLHMRILSHPWSGAARVNAGAVSLDFDLYNEHSSDRIVEISTDRLVPPGTVGACAGEHDG